MVSSIPGSVFSISGEVIVLTINTLFSPDGGELVLFLSVRGCWNKLLKKTISEYTQIFPDPYPHWTIKEIFEQNITIDRAINSGGRIENNFCTKLGGLESKQEDLLKIKHDDRLKCSIELKKITDLTLKELDQINNFEVLRQIELKSMSV